MATAFGVKAIKNGFSVAHFILDDLMHVLKADAAIPAYVISIDGRSYRLRELGALLSEPGPTIPHPGGKSSTAPALPGARV